MPFLKRKSLKNPITLEFAINMYKLGFALTLKDGRILNILEK